MGFSKAELESLPRRRGARLLPSSQELRLLFVGINPGLWTAAVQTHFAHPVNRFYPALLQAGILTEPVDPSAGMTDGPGAVPRPRAGHHQPRPAGHRQGLRAHRRRAACGW